MKCFRLLTYKFLNYSDCTSHNSGISAVYLWWLRSYLSICPCSILIEFYPNPLESWWLYSNRVLQSCSPHAGMAMNYHFYRYRRAVCAPPHDPTVNHLKPDFALNYLIADCLAAKHPFFVWRCVALRRYHSILLAWIQVQFHCPSLQLTQKLEKKKVESIRGFV